MVKVGDYVECFYAGRLFKGQVNAIDGGLHFVEITPGVYIPVTEECVVILPARLVGLAKQLIAGSVQAAMATGIASYAPVFVTGAAAEGVFGAAAIMQGLKFVGTAVGGGAAVGLVLIAAAPAMLATSSLRFLATGVGSDRTAANITAAAGGVGGWMCVQGVAITFCGASGPAIMTTLSGLAGSGAGGALVGVGVVAGSALMAVAVPGVVAFLGVQSVREAQYALRRGKWLEMMMNNQGGGPGYPPPPPAPSAPSAPEKMPTATVVN